MYIFLFTDPKLWERYIVNNEPYPRLRKDRKRIYRTCKNWQFSRIFMLNGTDIQFLVTGRKHVHIYEVIRETTDHTTYLVKELMDFCL